MRPSLGLMFQREYPPEELVAAAREYEGLGFDDLWLVEDLGFAGGLTSAALALQATTSINIGVGILAAAVRNPVFAAMEIATLARLYPDRLIAGFGHGVQTWMGAVGEGVSSPLTLFRETLDVVGGLLRGDHVTLDGRYVQVQDASLEFPPAVPPIVLAGVRSEKSLEISGRACDGALLAEPATPEYVRWALERMSGPAKEAGRVPPAVAAYAYFSVDADADVARDRLRTPLANNLSDPTTHVHLQGLTFGDELIAVCRNESVAERAAALKPEWISALSVAGTPEDCAAAIAALADAGASRVILLPAPGQARQQAAEFAESVLPILP
jgi:5,10-methylenetetrahydromethanopterin reductase